MITIPVLVNFDSTKIVGTMTLDEGVLSEDNTNYVFSLGYMAECVDSITPTKFNGRYELFCVSLLTAEQYLNFIGQKDNFS